MKKIKITTLSDTHGLLLDLPESDLIIHAGDFLPAYNHSVNYQKKWIYEEFLPWVKGLKCQFYIQVPGNHDFVFEGNPYFKPSGFPEKCIFLIDECCTVCGLKIWGSPWSCPFNNWAFQLPENIAFSIYKQIPEDVDIVISHGPPWKHGDKVIHQTKIDGTPLVEPFVRHTGSKVLFNRLLELQPKLVVTGHIHESAGVHPIINGEINIPVANVSVLDGEYELVNKPIIFEF